MSEEINGLLESLGITPTPATPATEPVVTDSAPAEPNSDIGGATPTTDPEPIVTTSEPTADPAISAPLTMQKQNKAFAEMRVQNQQYQKTIKSLGELLGVQDTSNMDSVLNVVKEKVVQAQAKQQGVPAEILNKLNMLEEEQQRTQQQSMQQQALLGFQKVKTDFGLDDKGMDAFTNKLVELGVNPFEQQIDLVRVYKDVYFDDLVQKRIEQALQAERALVAKGTQNATTPSATTGQAGDPNQVKIKDVKGLESWFEQQNKTK